MVSVDRLGEAGVAGVGGTIWFFSGGCRAVDLWVWFAATRETLMDATAFFPVLAAFQPVKVFADLVVRARLALGLSHDCVWSCWLGAFGRGVVWGGRCPNHAPESGSVDTRRYLPLLGHWSTGRTWLGLAEQILFPPDLLLPAGSFDQRWPRRAICSAGSPLKSGTGSSEGLGGD